MLWQHCKEAWHAFTAKNFVFSDVIENITAQLKQNLKGTNTLTPHKTGFLLRYNSISVSLQ